MGVGFERFEDPFDARRDLLEGVIVDVVGRVGWSNRGCDSLAFLGKCNMFLGDLGDLYSMSPAPSEPFASTGHPSLPSPLERAAFACSNGPNPSQLQPLHQTPLSHSRH